MSTTTRGRGLPGPSGAGSGRTSRVISCTRLIGADDQRTAIGGSLQSPAQIVNHCLKGGTKRSRGPVSSETFEFPEAGHASEGFFEAGRIGNLVGDQLNTRIGPGLLKDHTRQIENRDLRIVPDI